HEVLREGSAQVGTGRSGLPREGRPEALHHLPEHRGQGRMCLQRRRRGHRGSHRLGRGCLRGCAGPGERRRRRRQVRRREDQGRGEEGGPDLTPVKRAWMSASVYFFFVVGSSRKNPGEFQVCSAVECKPLAIVSCTSTPKPAKLSHLSESTTMSAKSSLVGPQRLVLMASISFVRPPYWFGKFAMMLSSTVVAAGFAPFPA